MVWANYLSSKISYTWLQSTRISRRSRHDAPQENATPRMVGKPRPGDDALDAAAAPGPGAGILPGTRAMGPAWSDAGGIRRPRHAAQCAAPPRTEAVAVAGFGHDHFRRIDQGHAPARSQEPGEPVAACLRSAHQAHQAHACRKTTGGTRDGRTGGNVRRLGAGCSGREGDWRADEAAGEARRGGQHFDSMKRARTKTHRP